MDYLAKRINNVSLSATAQIQNLVIKKLKSNKSVYSLSAGEPDFDTPRNIKDAAITAIKRGLTKYTATDGLFELKRAIKNKFERDNNLSYRENEIIVCSGGKQVIFNALMATLNHRDEVAIVAPYWVSYPDITRICGGIPKVIHTNIQDNFKLSAKMLHKNITEKTKWLIINSPTNPTGAVYTLDELLELAEILKEFPQVKIITDDIYEHIVYDGKSFYNILQADNDLKDRTLVVNGVSKAYAMTGWRIGYGAAKKPLIDAMKIIQSQSTSNASSISQQAAIEALNGPQNVIIQNKIKFENRRDLVMDILRQAPDLVFIKPDGAFYILISIKNLLGKKTTDGKVILTDEDFATQLLQKTGVAVVPGSAFGLSASFRVSFSLSETQLNKASYLIVKFVNSLCKKSV